jgi:argininosuccinate lyase
MMPQKRNPDVFELVRGKSGRAVGNLVSLLVMVKGLPGGYNRDLQEDRAVILESGPLVKSVLSILELALPRMRLDRERALAALEGDYTQATDLAEALVRKGMPFREAYQVVGTLVRKLQEHGLPMARTPLELARGIHPALDAEVLGVAQPSGSVKLKEVAGSTGPQAVRAQLATLRSVAEELARAADVVPTLDSLFRSLKEAPL